MPEFVLDTSGAVNYVVPGTPSPAPNCQFHTRWQDLDAFTQGYIKALFFTEAEGLKRESAHYDGLTEREAVFADLAPEALERIIHDCTKFQATQAFTFINSGNLQASRPELDNEQAGHDFWLTRNGHGAGFWDGDWPEPYATQLDDAAKAFGEVDVYLGDDGKVHLG